MFQKILTILCCTYFTIASEHTHIIPVENYDTELQDLGQHVEIPETPVKIIKITKTIAVKVPVPYPVKVLEKVPYPVHVSKPYPVPVPQIVKVPQVINVGSQGKSSHESLDGGSFQGHHFDGNTYQVREQPSSDIGHGYNPDSGYQTYGGASYGISPHSGGDEHLSQGSSEGFEGSLSSGYNGYSGGQDNSNAFESNSYDQAIQNYLEKHSPSGGASVPHY